MKRRLTAMAMAAAALVALACVAGCAQHGAQEGGEQQEPLLGGESVELTTTLDAASPGTGHIDAPGSPAADPTTAHEKAPLPTADFTVGLLQGALQAPGNPTVSPLSALSALSMTANGASGSTLQQMEAALGAPVDTLNAQLGTYMETLAAAEAAAEAEAEAEAPTEPGPTDSNQPSGLPRVELANSVWIRDTPTLHVHDDFLHTVAGTYRAAAFKAPFDASTKNDVNAWVEGKTHGKVVDLLDRIDPDAMMYLVNALYFNAKWESPFDHELFEPGMFTSADGAQTQVDLMTCRVDAYLEAEGVSGFVKPYEGGRCSFVALLPNEGTSVDDFVAGLSGQQLSSLLAGVREESVTAMMPQFTSEFGFDLSDTLQDMGMTDAFSPMRADFTRMAECVDGNLFVSRVLQKCYVDVTDEGTEAAAATLVEMVEESAVELAPCDHEVRLDRPFVYLIVDDASAAPLFAGVVRSV